MNKPSKKIQTKNNQSNFKMLEILDFVDFEDYEGRQFSRPQLMNDRLEQDSLYNSLQY